MVLYTANFYENPFQDINTFELALRCIKCEERKVFYIVKMHPHQSDVKSYKEIMRKLSKSAVFLTGYYDLWDLFAASDVLLTEYSTTLIEGITA
ncbi:MAG: CDP-glycerol glycerophosphotransferase family protein, partial [Nitrososphaerales archaeon]|nr:CDP-glycerol glycerophosphotransferase family protein [Nitrososphaerales archaeon]